MISKLSRQEMWKWCCETCLHHADILIGNTISCIYSSFIFFHRLRNKRKKKSPNREIWQKNVNSYWHSNKTKLKTNQIAILPKNKSFGFLLVLHVKAKISDIWFLWNWMETLNILSLNITKNKAQTNQKKKQI